jgi:hypothetical protein
MDSSKLAERVDVKDLMRLFGEVGEDDEGLPFIFADEDQKAEHLRVLADSDDEEGGVMGDEA